MAATVWMSPHENSCSSGSVFAYLSYVVYTANVVRGGGRGLFRYAEQIKNITIKVLV